MERQHIFLFVAIAFLIIYLNKQEYRNV